MLIVIPKKRNFKHQPNLVDCGDNIFGKAIHYPMLTKGSFWPTGSTLAAAISGNLLVNTGGDSKG